MKESCDIRIGTSGYDYPEWDEVFYQKGLGRSEYLGAYSEVFDTIELNFSYYGMPKADNMRSMLKKTRRPIDFVIKANQKLTHKINMQDWKTDATEYALGISPLATEDRLCALLFEFPFSFHYGEEERRYLDKLLRFFSAFPLVVEFRNAEWINSRVIDGLRSRNTALCSIDAPRIKGLPPMSDLVTSNLAYVRFHGRNSDSWWSGNSASRYDYAYTKDELASWLPRLEAMSTESKKLRVFFNNHRRGNAPKNAKDLISLVKSSHLI